MKAQHPRGSLVSIIFLSLSVAAGANASDAPGAPAGPVLRRLYVAVRGVRDYLEYGGHGLLIYDIDQSHRFMKRIPTAGLDPGGKPLNVKGICACAATKKLYISTTKQLMCIDLVSEKLLWEKSYELGCDRMAITPDGQRIFLPSFEGPLWYVVRGDDGEVLARITPNSGSHNTLVALDGKEAYLAGLKSPFLTVIDVATCKPVRTVGPFAASIRPFTVSGRQRLCFVNVNELLGFEVGDLGSAQKRFRIEVKGFAQGPTKRHGCPSHGIGLTPDEQELWLTDAFNCRLHIFKATVMPPEPVGEIVLRDQPGWITFGIDGRYAYPSTGEVIDVQSRKIIGTLKDENGRDVQSEKMVEVDFQGTEPLHAGDQFGIGRALAPAPPPALSGDGSRVPK
jgi:hypothetical protein